MLALVALLLALAACGGGDSEPAAPATSGAATTGEEAASTGAEAGTPASLKVALDWFPNPDHVALYYALDRGLWEDRGLSVELQTPSDPSAGLKLVATGRFDLAVYYEGDMFFAAEQGLPVVAVGALIPTPLNSLIALADSRVTSPETISGASVGISGLPFDEAIIDTIRKTQGLPDDDPTVVNVGFNLVPALLTGRVDATIGGYWNIEGPELELETGEAPTIIRLEELGVPPYDELVIVANAERLASDEEYADAVRRFLAGMVEGAKGAIEDEAGALAIMERSTDYTAEELEAMVPATIGVLDPPGERPLGCFDLPGWERFGRWMLETGLLEAAIDPATIATNEYLPGC